MKVLITGCNSGLGAYFTHKLPESDVFTRSTPLNRFRGTYYDLVIHCAVNLTHYRWDSDIPYGFFDDNIFLTQRLLGLDYGKFVYISSIDHAKGTPYGAAKRISEVLVRESASDHLIVRPSGMLGASMKENTFQKILQGKPIALTADSVMNYVLYDDVLELVTSGASGTLPVVASENITMAGVCEVVGRDVEFGSFKFDISIEDGAGQGTHTSRENIIRYLNKYHERTA